MAYVGFVETGGDSPRSPAADERREGLLVASGDKELSLLSAGESEKECSTPDGRLGLRSK